MKVTIDVIIEPENQGDILDPAEIEKDLKLYLIDFSLIMKGVDPPDIVGGFNVIQARAAVQD